ncbi:unnamed protein product [Discula destructiva]
MITSVGAANGAFSTTSFRGLPTPSGSGDEQSDKGNATPQMIAADKPDTPATATPILRGRRSRLPVGDDIVSANCSPVIRPDQSPVVGGISLLRSQIDDLSLNGETTSRASSKGRAYRSKCSNSKTSKLGSKCTSMTSSGPYDTPVAPTPRRLLGGWEDDDEDNDSHESGYDDDDESTEYEINLEEDFVSENAPKQPAAQGDGIFEDGLEGIPANPSWKVTIDDFVPIRVLGKGAYGTVILVQQCSTGRLYAQKTFKKASLVIHKKLVDQTNTERQILERVNKHPFVVKLFYAFQDKERLYLILEYGMGGELFHHLETERMFAEPKAAFYLAEMVLALSHLHDNLGIIYRDLKPENILLDSDGHLLLTDFGLSKVAEDGATAKSFLGTVEYMAPEVIKGEKYGKAVDWWGLGALAYDMLVGNSPFQGGNNRKIQDNILKQKVALPYFLSADAKDLITRLLKKDPKKRLGSNMPKDLAIIKGHRFFKHIDWTKLAARKLEPPILPMITNPALAENFSDEFTNMTLDPSYTATEPKPMSPPSRFSEPNPFSGFSFAASSSLLNSDYGLPLGQSFERRHC